MGLRYPPGLPKCLYINTLGRFWGQKPSIAFQWLTARDALRVPKGKAPPTGAAEARVVSIFSGGPLHY